MFEKVKGAYAWDVDGNKYIDYVCTWGPSIVGHANDEVLDALRETLIKGEQQLQSSVNLMSQQLPLLRTCLIASPLHSQEQVSAPLAP